MSLEKSVFSLLEMETEEQQTLGWYYFSIILCNITTYVLIVIINHSKLRDSDSKNNSRGRNQLYYHIHLLSVSSTSPLIVSLWFQNVTDFPTDFCNSTIGPGSNPTVVRVLSLSVTKCKRRTNL